jgi:type I restriction enzyme S subunit
VLKTIEINRKKEAKGSQIEKLNEIYNDDSTTINFTLPFEWQQLNLDKVCHKFTYGTSTKSDEFGDFVVLRMGNLQNGKIDWGNLKFTSDISEYKKYELSKGDLLFNRTNSPELVGKTSIYDGTNKSIYAGYLIKIWNLEELDSYYLNFVMNSDFVKKWCWEVKSDGVSQSNINAQKLSKLTIPFPSLEEQQEIVTRVESLFAKADSIEQQYKTLKEKTDNLPQALLHKAFKGELVPQLAGDGDARELLEEIKGLRDDMVKKEKKCKINA